MVSIRLRSERAESAPRNKNWWYTYMRIPCQACGAGRWRRRMYVHISICSMRQPQAHLRPYIRCFLVTGEEVRGNLEEAAKSFISQGSYASPRNCGDAASGWLPILLRMFRVCVMVGIKYKVCVGWAPVKCAPLGGYWRSGFWTWH
jgi:hypothetical protein